MKTKLLAIALSFLLLVNLSGCAKFKNKVARDGAFFGSENGDWIVVKYSGGKITDVWKLKNVMLQSEEHSDGWLFQDDSGNVFNLAGDTKAIRVKEAKLWDKYHEYHIEFDMVPYEDAVKKQ